MQAEDGRRNSSISRRDFLKYSFSTGVVIWAGSQFPREAEAQALFNVESSDPAIVFPQSVASGDPQQHGIVLWTRVASLRAGSKVAYEVARDTTFRKPILRGTAQTSEQKDNTVKVQINRTELRPFTTYYYRFIYNGTASRTGRFKTLPMATGAVPEDRVRFGYISCQDYTNGYYNALYHLAQEEMDFVVHLGDYIYETVESESFQGNGPPDRQFLFPKDQSGDDGTEATTLMDYRFAYKKYKTDPNLQAVHEKFAFIMVWDDHEFANDCYQTYAPDQDGNTEGNKNNPPRREAATRAWAEFNPIGVPYKSSLDPLNEIRIYRSFAFGDLMELVMTDQRLYRDGPPNGNDIQDRYATPGAGKEGEGEESPERTMLGDGTPGENGLSRPNQLENYFLQRIKNSPRTWKIWGNEVTFMQLKVANTSLNPPLGTPTVLSLEELFPGIGEPPFPPRPAASDAEGVYITLDQWDGYQAERLDITKAVRGPEEGTDVEVKNFVTLTGDIHSYIAGYIKAEYDDRTCGGPNRPVGVELVCPSVTSSNLSELATFGFGVAPVPKADAFTAQVEVNNPHIKFFNSNEHGYNLIEVASEYIVCTMKAIRPGLGSTQTNAIREPDPAKTTAQVLKKFRIREGQVLLIDETNAIPVPLPCDVPTTTPSG